ncbi:MAG: DCC1-like thiol-disulfide oxidoreductase family protein [Acidimicrobiales bacterium]
MTQKHLRVGSLLIFDGDCGFCTTVAGWTARRFRRGERAEAWQLLDAEVLEHHGLNQRDVQDAAWWVDESGLRERGHRAVGRALHAKGGLFKVLSFFILNPPTSWLAAVIYKLIVRSRYKLPGATPACRVIGHNSKSS